MDVLSPNTLEKALGAKAEHPDAVPIQGGTDLMVELNFDRRRPDVLLNLNEVAELRGWSREKGRVRLASGLTYAEAMGADIAALSRARGGLAHGRLAPDPQPGTIGGNLGTASPAGDALRRSSSRTQRSSSPRCGGCGRCRCASSSSGRNGTPPSRTS